MRAISPFNEASRLFACPICVSIDAFAAARCWTTRCCAARSFASNAALRCTAPRNVFTSESTRASSEVTLLALSMRLIMSSRVRAPSTTSSVDA